MLSLIQYLIPLVVFLILQKRLFWEYIHKKGIIQIRIPGFLSVHFVPPPLFFFFPNPSTSRSLLLKRLGTDGLSPSVVSSCALSLRAHSHTCAHTLLYHKAFFLHSSWKKREKKRILWLLISDSFIMLIYRRLFISCSALMATFNLFTQV